MKVIFLDIDGVLNSELFYRRRHNNISFGLWGFYYNSFYQSVTFGISIETDKVEEFVEKLRKIINK